MQEMLKEREAARRRQELKERIEQEKRKQEADLDRRMEEGGGAGF